ncbi:alpha/beta hydrolase [Enterococcus sp. AZ072]|uniref:alpha/beta hydrolase n=1 Tax=unclassified Enterococcus TaxID=2608891 RepID=UPI003D2A2CFA
MKLKTIELPAFCATVDLYLRNNVSHGKDLLPAVIICPGGGYQMISDRESEPIALAFLSHGYHTLVINYPVLAKNETITPDYLDNNTRLLADIFKEIEDKQDKWKIDPNAVFLLGCSAGGHMASLYAGQWQKVAKTKNLSHSKPLGNVLCYPVIGFDYGWPNASGLESELLKAYDAAAHINAETPDTFIWHTVNDSLISVLHSLKYCEGLTKQTIPFEGHFFENGRHGLSLSTRASAESKKGEQINQPVAKWLPLCVEWMERRLNY